MAAVALVAPAPPDQPRQGAVHIFPTHGPSIFPQGPQGPKPKKTFKLHFSTICQGLFGGKSSPIDKNKFWKRLIFFSKNHQKSMKNQQKSIKNGPPGAPGGAPARPSRPPAPPGAPGARFLLIFVSFSLIFDCFLLFFNPWGPWGMEKFKKYQNFRLLGIWDHGSAPFFTPDSTGPSVLASSYQKWVKILVF